MGNLDKTRWRPVTGYKGKYLVSDSGDVMNAETGKILKPYGHTKGYAKVDLRHLGASKRDERFVHRLVADAFIKNPNALPEVNHLNGNKLDNRVENLEWCTDEYNQIYGRAMRKLKKALSEEENG